MAIGRGLSGAIRQERVRIGRIRADVNASATKAVFDGAARFVNRLRNQHLSGPTGARSVSVISGRLRASVRAIVRTSRTQDGGLSASVEFEMGSGLPWGTIHIRGGIIRARRAPYLVFKTRDGKWHSVKRVKIPARIPFMEIATDELARIRQRVRVELQKALALR